MQHLRFAEAGCKGELEERLKVVLAEVHARTGGLSYLSTRLCVAAGVMAAANPTKDADTRTTAVHWS